MTTLLLVRHGLTALTGPVLAGRTPGLHLDERGQKQAASLAERLRPVPLSALVSSPLDRCLDTAAAIGAGRDQEVEIEPDLVEVDYGEWTGKEIKKLAKEPLWRVVQSHPAAAVFPGGEGLAAVSARAVAAVRRWNERLGAEAAYLICSHGDVIKALVADALGLHLDQFQRVQVSPCSLTVIRYTETRPFVERVNDTGSPIDALLSPKKSSRRKAASSNSRSSDAAVGGGAG